MIEKIRKDEIRSAIPDRRPRLSNANYRMGNVVWKEHQLREAFRPINERVDSIEYLYIIFIRESSITEQKKIRYRLEVGQRCEHISSLNSESTTLKQVMV